MSTNQENEKTTAERVRDVLLENLADSYTLVSVQYDDSFDGNLEIQRATLTGDDDAVGNEYSDRTDEWIADQRYESAADAILDLLETHIESEEEREEFQADADAWDEVRFAIEDRDDSDTFNELWRNTSGTWITYKLHTDEDVDYIYGDAYVDEETRAENRKAVLEALGIAHADESVSRWLEEVFANAYYGGELMVLWHGKTKDIADQINDDTKSILFPAGSEVGLIDYWNGSGYTESIPCDIHVPFDRERFGLDKLRSFGGYADGVCGLVSSAFRDPAPVLSADEVPQRNYQLAIEFQSPVADT